MAEYKLYWREGSGSVVIDAALALCGIEPVRLRIDTASREHQKQPFLSVNPMAQIPVLALPDGTVLSETAAILLHLADAFPKATLLPPAGTSERARALRWFMLQATTFYSAAVRDAYPGRYTTQTGEEAEAGVRRAAHAEMARVMAILADALEGPFLIGRTRTVADVYLAMLAEWFPPSLENARLKAHHDAVLADPLVAAAWRRHAQPD